MVVKELAELVSPWNTLYGQSKVVATAVTSVHVLALLFGGGFAVAADRTTIRALRHPASQRLGHLRELKAVHRPVLISLALLFVSGIAMALADVETFATSPYFWIKLGLVALLCLNGAYLYFVENRLNALAVDVPPDERSEPALWSHLRVASALSLALWGLTTLAGTVLTGAA